VTRRIAGRRAMPAAGLVLAALGAWARPMPERPIIAVAPVGRVSARALALVAPAIRDGFGSEVVTAPALALPEGAFDPRRGQHRSTALLDALARAKRPGGERLLGVADVDLYVPELNFVFGEADPSRGVAVFSLHRLHPPPPGDEALLARRAATEAIHELGHTFGLGHCAEPRCVMWFSNTLAESDRKGTAFCASHAAELRRRRRSPAPPHGGSGERARRPSAPRLRPGARC